MQFAHQIASEQELACIMNLQIEAVYTYIQLTSTEEGHFVIGLTWQLYIIINEVRSYELVTYQWVDP